MAEVKINQNTNGGVREGAGRKKGSGNKLRVTDFFNGAERDQLILEAKMLAFGDGETKPDKDMIKFLWEQLFGKAQQAVDLTTGGEMIEASNFTDGQKASLLALLNDKTSTN